jgi:hypothetical protein
LYAFVAPIDDENKFPLVRLADADMDATISYSRPSPRNVRPSYRNFANPSLISDLLA